MTLRPLNDAAPFPAAVFVAGLLAGFLFRSGDGFTLLRLAGQQRCADLVEVEEACK